MILFAPKSLESRERSTPRLELSLSDVRAPFPVLPSPVGRYHRTAKQLGGGGAIRPRTLSSDSARRTAHRSSAIKSRLRRAAFMLLNRGRLDPCQCLIFRNAAIQGTTRSTDRQCVAGCSASSVQSQPHERGFRCATERGHVRLRLQERQVLA